MIHKMIVFNVTCSTIKSLVTLAIGADSIVAKIEPDILAAVVRADSIIPPHLSYIYSRTVPIMTDLLSSLLWTVIVLSLTRSIKLMLIVQEAAIVTWVFDYRFEAPYVFLEKIVHNGLTHILALFLFLVLYFCWENFNL